MRSSFYLFWRLAIWIVPLSLLGLSIHQLFVWIGLYQTYTYGEMISATIIDHDIKYIGSQTNGYIVLEYQDNNTRHTQKLSLPVALLHIPNKEANIIISYSPKSFQPIVIRSIYHSHIGIVRSHLLFLVFSVLFSTFLIIWLRQKKKEIPYHPIAFKYIDRS